MLFFSIIWLEFKEKSNTSDSRCQDAVCVCLQCGRDTADSQGDSGKIPAGTGKGIESTWGRIERYQRSAGADRMRRGNGRG